jgi:membrane-associated phospholipid phosphatase
MARKKHQGPRQLTRVERIDLKVSEAVALDARSGRSIAILREYVDERPLLAGSGTFLAVGLALRDRRIVHTGARMLAAVRLTALIKDLVKDRVTRTRPYQASGHSNYLLKPGHNGKKACRSLPSGHSAGAVAFCRAATRGFPNAALPLSAGAATIAALQVPSRNHFPSDILLGAAIGLIGESVASTILDWIGDLPIGRTLNA